MNGGISRAAALIIGSIFLVFDIVLYLFAIVAAIFAIYIMIGMILEWTTELFKRNESSDSVQRSLT